MSIVELERLVTKGAVTRLVFETPLGIITIGTGEIKYTRDGGNHAVVIHRFGCRVEKHKKAKHDDTDIRDMPWMSVFVDLTEKDHVQIGQSNTSWTFGVGTEKMKLVRVE